MKKSFLIIALVFLIYGCGYQPVDLGNYEELTIKEIKILKASALNNKIKKNLISYSKPDKNIVLLELDSKKDINIKSKDTKGNALIYKLQITTNILLKKNGKTFVKSLNESFIYNTKDNQFSLKQYEKDIEKNLINKIVKEILVFITKSN